MNEKKLKFVKRVRNEETPEKMIEGVLNKDRAVLAKVITLIESSAIRHQEQAQIILQKLLPHTGNTIRIGVTGVPGAGKSTFIETFGYLLCEQGYRVAVLAVDPSSTINGGSILGDKTRMEKLSTHPNAFIRPSPSGGVLGGVHLKTRESILACEAAGFNVIIVETVGVGQSESIVRSMVDFYLMLVLTGAGDELQGMKKGILELVDLIVVNKADGENVNNAKKTTREYNQILHFIQPSTAGWETKATMCSSLTGEGIDEIWKRIQEFFQVIQSSTVFKDRRQSQVKEWLFSLIKERLETNFFSNKNVRKLLPEIEDQIINDQATVSEAVDALFREYKKKDS
ncbi:methylmalonyl Co-A mutase-associated GTPase MeaB [Lederbergia wuyishanensis]|uniref:LAO/AO transport system kinase n=1 Tax=Lederbergia wuyishanensis TaxID=1347903 RepID=A0ABU0D177_9BACI|nr:methylmalonyl Co-A mutase-associated GTPase MeaB [Lederbergia wuyishanensis]MCJ8006768.1 methylmalonyl Co-A mutase-associated GTPase MeaB [Lederbergia wuyishanensis]MDQ0342150.1 LAO/AO transport system kinase [Lederbergia wuyishanensis]